MGRATLPERGQLLGQAVAFVLLIASWTGGGSDVRCAESLAPAPMPEAFERVNEKPWRARPISAQVESAADSATIYRNEGDQFKSSLDPNPVLEDISVQPGTGGQPLQIRSIEFGYYVNADVPLLVEVRFWDSFNPNATPVNSGLLGMESIDLGDQVSPHSYLAGPILLTTPIPLADPDLAIQFDYKRDDDLTSVGTAVTVLFSGSGVSIGSSPDRYYRDTNNNGIFDPADARNFNGPPNLANFFVQLQGAADPNVVDPGIDLWQTPGGGTTFRDFGAQELGPGFFDSDDNGVTDCTAGRGSSDPSSGGVVFVGTPLVDSPSGAVYPADTIVKRLAGVNLPTPGSTGSTPLQIAALSLTSAGPFAVTRNAGASIERWDVKICLSDSPQPLGTMYITKGQCPNEGGTFTATLPVLPKLIFTRRPPDAPCKVTLDYGPIGMPPLAYQTSKGHWLSDVPLALRLREDPAGGTQVDGNCDGLLDIDPLPGTTPFKAGVRIPRSPADHTCGPTDPAMIRLTGFQYGASPQAGTLGLLPALMDQTDADLDRVPDEGDNCVGVSNPLQQDPDDDGKGTACDPCPNDAANDADQDGVCGDVDNCPNVANANQADADHDGLGDACDACPQDAQNDADHDGVCGNVDNCPTVANASQADADHDGLGDACDACPLDAANDADHDGVCGNVDNCPTVANASQADADHDGLGDACDPCPLDAQNDADHDGVCGNVDNCPLTPNPNQADADGDGLGDACDACPLDPANDADHDGVCGNLDNCPTVANPSQADADHDGLGDACDPCPLDAANDADGDGVCGDVDNCPTVFNPSQADADADGIGDACDSCPTDPTNDVDQDGLCGLSDPCPLDAQNDADGDGVCGDVDNCPTVPNPDQADADADGLGDACDCDPSDPTNPSLPGELTHLTFVNKRRIVWDVSPMASSYQVLRDQLTGLPVGPGYAGETCFPNLSGNLVVDQANPSVKQGFWYLALGKNSCGAGSLGFAARNGVPMTRRKTLTCP